MVVTTAIPESWSETAKVSICAEGGNDILFESLTETIDIDLGDKDIDQIVTTKGGRLVKYMPQDLTTVTLEAYPLQAGTAAVTAGATGTGFFDLMNTADASQPLAISADLVRTRVRIAVLWTNDTANTGAHNSVAIDKMALRFVGCGFVISAKQAMTDGILKWTVKIKCPPFKKDGTANIKVESGDATATVPTLGAFTATVNW